jgi:hypothetical protein
MCALKKDSRFCFTNYEYHIIQVVDEYENITYEFDSIRPFNQIELKELDSLLIIEKYEFMETGPTGKKSIKIDCERGLEYLLAVEIKLSKMHGGQLRYKKKDW